MGQKSSRQKQQPWGQVQQPQPFGAYQHNPFGGPPPFLPPGYQPTPGPYAPIPNQQPFVPPGTYLPPGGVTMPQPQLIFMPEDKRPKEEKAQKWKRRFRPQSEQVRSATAGRATGMNMPQPQIPNGPGGTQSSRRRASESAAIPSSSKIRGTPAPVIPRHFDDDDDEDEDDEDDGEDDRASSSSASSGPPRSTVPPPSARRSQRSHRQPPITGNIQDVLRPPSPADDGGPYHPPRPRPIPGRLRNPLPPPPRDVYTMTPYKGLIELPRTMALLTATYGPAQQVSQAAANVNPNPNLNGGVQATTLVIPPGGQGMAAIVPPGGLLPGQTPQPPQGNLKKSGSQKKKSRVSGLFRAISGKRKKSEDIPPVAPQAPNVAQPAGVQFVPVFLDGDKRPGFAASVKSGKAPAQSRRNSTMGTATSTTVVATDFANAGGADRTKGPAVGNASAQTAGQQPPQETVYGPGFLPPNYEDERILRFDQMSRRYAGFMNHSPHRVVFEDREYPTATHLFEAMKFMPDHPELAEAIRLTKDPIDAYFLSADSASLARADWYETWRDELLKIVKLKFEQHPNLRHDLMQTGHRELIYTDAMDTYWGVGPDRRGDNELGQLLMQVREMMEAEIKQGLGLAPRAE